MLENKGGIPVFHRDAAFFHKLQEIFVVFDAACVCMSLKQLTLQGRQFRIHGLWCLLE